MYMTRVRIGRSPVLAVVVALLTFAGLALAQNAQTPSLGYTDTPMLPGGKWHVHDSNRPQPRVVSPGASLGAPPSDAEVLFGGTDLSKWQATDGSSPARWKIESGDLVVSPGAGNISTREAFGDCQLHVEWSTPSPPKGEGQDRGNSGVFLMSRYEIQVLDSYQAQTYPTARLRRFTGSFHRSSTRHADLASGRSTTSSSPRLVSRVKTLPCRRRSPSSTTASSYMTTPRSSAPRATGCWARTRRTV